MYLVKLKNVPILEQLRLEEALLRADKGDWCLISTGAPPAIVMGISGKPDQLLNVEKVQQDRIQVIKRFSGGGTVYIDPKTVFVTFVCNAVTIPAQPKPILKWSEQLYQPLFQGFEARENDYVFGEKKFGGNAQYIQKGRWLHHTSFLWDYEPTNMDYLTLPERRPHYRQDRDHADFLCTLRPHFPQKERLLETFVTHFSNILNTKSAPEGLLEEILDRPHRKVSTPVTL